jgi:hypothetical protein
MVTSDSDYFVAWPLCYICCILEAFAKRIPRIESAVEGIVKCYDQLRNAKYRSGGWWEGIANIAILINCLLSMSNPKYSPFGLYATHVSKLVYLSLPPQINSLDVAKAEIDIELTKYNYYPLVLVATPNHAQFERMDGIIVHQENNASQVKYYGYQMKEGNQFPDNSELPDWMTSGILLQGNAPMSRNRSDPHWIYPNKESIEKFLGYSLAPAYPANISQLTASSPSSL